MHGYCTRMIIITARRSYASARGLGSRNSVRLSVRLSHACFVTKQRIYRRYRRLIPKSAFMQFLAILTFLHIWKNECHAGLFENGRAVTIFFKIKGVIAPYKSGTGRKTPWSSELQVPSSTISALLSES